MNWDFLITTIVVIGLILVVWAKVSRQTIKDVILDIKDLLTNSGEVIEDRIEGVEIYE